jgi:hypothetical protein
MRSRQGSTRRSAFDRCSRKPLFRDQGCATAMECAHGSKDRAAKGHGRATSMRLIAAAATLPVIGATQ